MRITRMRDPARTIRNRISSSRPDDRGDRDRIIADLRYGNQGGGLPANVLPPPPRSGGERLLDHGNDFGAVKRFGRCCCYDSTDDVDGCRVFVVGAVLVFGSGFVMAGGGCQGCGS